jgi:hypothetical protein
MKIKDKKNYEQQYKLFFYDNKKKTIFISSLNTHINVYFDNIYIYIYQKKVCC